MKPPLLICLIGAECTGKTTLTKALAVHFDGLWVDEYLRSFCAEAGRTPRRDEQALILETQLAQETAQLALARDQQRAFVFCDTAPLLTAIYSDFYFSDSSLYPRAHQLHTRYALTLNLLPDVPWEADGIQHDGAHVRAPLQAIIERELSRLAQPFVRIAGVGEARLQAAIAALETLSAESLLATR